MVFMDEWVSEEEMLAKTIGDLAERIKNKENEVKNINYDIAIMTAYEIKLYNDLNYWNPYDDKMLENLKKAIHGKTKGNLKEYEEQISGTLFEFRNKIKIIDVEYEYDKSMHTVRYQVSFKIKGNEYDVFFISVPCKSRTVVTEGDIEYKNYSFGLRENETTYHIIFRTFNYQKLKHRFMDYINNKEYKKKGVK